MEFANFIEKRFGYTSQKTNDSTYSVESTSSNTSSEEPLISNTDANQYFMNRFLRTN